MPRPLSIAHRGASGHELENTRAAFRRARTLGADGVELDVHATRDGILVVHHDEEVPGLGRIAELAMSQITAHKLGNGESIPALAEVLPLLRGLDVWVEVKAIEEYLDAVLLRTLSTGPEPERYAVHSFDHRVIRRLSEREPALRRGVLLEARLVDPLAVLYAANARVLWQRHDRVDAPLVELLQREQMQLVAWTANGQGDLERLTALGVFGICTDYPERVVALKT